MHDVGELGVGVIVSGDIDISCFFSVAITVHGVGFLSLVVGKGAKVLRPVSERCGSIEESVGTGYVWGGC